MRKMGKEVESGENRSHYGVNEAVENVIKILDTAKEQVLCKEVRINDDDENQ